MRTIRTSASLALAVLAMALASACDDDDSPPTPTPRTSTTATARPPATATARPPATATPSGTIHDVDFSLQPAVQDILRRRGGEVVPVDILFADITDDGADEAIVPVSSGGTAGNLALVVFTLRDGAVTHLLVAEPESGSIRAVVQDGQFIIQLPVYRQGDAPNFPSQIKRVFYHWDGENLVVEREDTIPNPNQPPKPY